MLIKFFEKNPDIRYIFLGGKGGVGKTTTSAAIALLLSKHGNRVLLTSTDPSHSLSDIFGRNVWGGKIQNIIDDVDVLEMNPEKNLEQCQNDLRNVIKSMYNYISTPINLNDYLDAVATSPAFMESAMFDQMLELIQKNEYDKFVFDTAPIGHTFRMLGMSRIFELWADHIFTIREQTLHYRERWKSGNGSCDSVLENISMLKQKIRNTRKILTDEVTTTFLFVLFPESLPILETGRTIDWLKKLEIPIGGVIVNRIIPECRIMENDPGYIKSRMKMQRKYLDMIEEQFGHQIQGKIELIETEVRGMDTIERISEMLG